eukprot:4538647-Prymnesium_polylepis.1
MSSITLTFKPNRLALHVLHGCIAGVWVSIPVALPPRPPGLCKDNAATYGFSGAPSRTPPVIMTRVPVANKEWHGRTVGDSNVSGV